MIYKNLFEINDIFYPQDVAMDDVFNYIGKPGYFGSDYENIAERVIERKKPLYLEGIDPYSENPFIIGSEKIKFPDGTEGYRLDKRSARCFLPLDRLK